MSLNRRIFWSLTVPVAALVFSGCQQPSSNGATATVAAAPSAAKAKVDPAAPVTLSPTHRIIPGNQVTALDRYVATPDPAYKWQVATNSTVAGGVVMTSIDLTSQTWLTTNEVDKPVWRHWLNIYRPPEVAHSTAFLMITGGNNRDMKPPKPGNEMAMIAMATKSVIAELKQVPSEPLVFVGDGKSRTEDEILAFGWAKYLKTGEERWIGRLPMAKSAVRAMDTVTAFCATPEGGSQKVDTFVVAGGSKRGWTTWATAEVDRRVVAIAPIVIDVLNLEPSFVHHWRAYGFWAPAVGNYVEEGVMDWPGTPEYAALRKIEDPFEYRERLTLPKLMVNACGDQFFLPDSSQFYFADLKGPKYLRYVPNADHSLKGSDAYETLTAWHYVNLNKITVPRFSWTHPTPGSAKLTLTDRPRKVKLWQATNPAARDFRLETLGAKWTSTDLAPDANGEVIGKVEAPAAGYTAYMVECTYDVGTLVPLKLTTDVRVIPDTYPFAAPSPSKLKGFLSGSPAAGQKPRTAN